MGAVSQSMAKAAQSRGVAIQTEAQVSKVLVERGRAIGVVLQDGQEIRAGAVVSNADPKRTFLGMVDGDDLPAGFQARVRGLKNSNASLKVHLALSEAPDLSRYFGDEWDPKYLARVRICPSLDYARAARQDAELGRTPDHPAMILQVPSVIDPSMAPEGQHCLSIWVETAAFNLAEGFWDDVKERVADHIVDTLASYAPNLKSAIIERDDRHAPGPGTGCVTHQWRYIPPGHDTGAVLRLPAPQGLVQLSHPNRGLVLVRCRDSSRRLRDRGPGPQFGPNPPARLGVGLLIDGKHPRRLTITSGAFHPENAGFNISRTVAQWHRRESKQGETCVQNWGSTSEARLPTSWWPAGASCLAISRRRQRPTIRRKV